MRKEIKDKKVKQHFISELDEIAVEMERVWGSGVLEQLADEEILKKFNNAKAKLNKAIDEDVSPEIMVKVCNNMKKGWLAIDKSVRLAGHKPPTGEYLTATSQNGKEFVIVKNDAEKDKVFDAIGGGIIYTTVEVANILETLNDVNECKKIFQKAKVTKFDCVEIDGRKVKVTGHDKDKKYYEPFDDDVPF